MRAVSSQLTLAAEGVAKGAFKAAVIGAVVIFGAGVIVSTVRMFTEDPLRFFQ